MSIYPLIKSIFKTAQHTEITRKPAILTEIFLKIFAMLTIPDMYSVSQVCHQWRKIVYDTSPQYLKLFLIMNIQYTTPHFSSWKLMPKHRGLRKLRTDQPVVGFTSYSWDGTVKFNPVFTSQSSLFSSFDAQCAFLDQYVFLAQYGDTYFFTPKSQIETPLHRTSVLDLLASHKLIIVNASHPEKRIEFSLLGNRPPTVNNLKNCQIEACFPFSENKIAILTSFNKISFWNLSCETPTCYCELSVGWASEVYKVGNFLLRDTMILNANDLTYTLHKFDFQEATIRTFEASFCADYEREIEYFLIDSQGVLEKKWSISKKVISESVDPKNGHIGSLYVQDLNKDFVLVVCCQLNAFNFLVINRKGEIVLSVEEPLLETVKIESIYRYPHFAHLADDILIYKNPQSHVISFIHIPSKECLIDFDWTQSIYDLPLLEGTALVQDVRFFDKKLTILLSYGQEPETNKPNQYRIIQFDSKYPRKTGFFHGVYSMWNSLYCALPS